jgi:uncharacterized protein (UPF0332 family)
MIGNSGDLIKYRIDRSLETLKEAKTMIGNKFWNASVNRIYYSCYYAVSALLLKKSIETNSHKGIRQMFGLHFVQEGLVAKEDGRFFLICMIEDKQVIMMITCLMMRKQFCNFITRQMDFC